MTINSSSTKVRKSSARVDQHPITVAVGTTIADHPPHRSVRARLRIRLLPGMRNGEASHRLRTQNMGSWNPSAQEWIESIPPHLCTLTAMYEYSSPQPAN